MTDLGPIWHLLRKSRLGRLIAAIVIGALVVLLTLAGKSPEKDIPRLAGLGALLGLVAVLPLEFLSWRKKRNPDENLRLSGAEVFLLLGYFLVVLFISAIVFM